MRSLVNILTIASTLVAVHATPSLMIPMCMKTFDELSVIAMSQDTLYNTAMDTCLAGSMKDWKYQSHFAYAPSELGAMFHIPDDARVMCARISMECSVKTGIPVSIFFDKINTKVESVSCARGVHVYSMTNIMKNPLVESLVVFQDLQINPLDKEANVSTTVSSEISWPFSMYKMSVEQKTKELMEKNSKNYVRELCK